MLLIPAMMQVITFSKSHAADRVPSCKLLQVLLLLLLLTTVAAAAPVAVFLQGS
jgi:hypothetical protein